MGEYTKSLQLYKADVVENANDTFNIETMLNDNWDKIDKKLEKLPIQNGGLYINSETTEEDKTGAVEAIKEIGLSASDVGALPADKKVTVQQGGWAIDENTTKEDKAEALNSINGFRHEKIIYGEEFFGNDIDTWFTAGIYNTSPTVVNTPCEDGYGTIVIFGSQNRTVQWFFSWNGEKSGMLQTRYKNYDIDWTEWKSFLPLDGSVPMSGNLSVEKSDYPAILIKDPTAGRQAKIEVEKDGAIIIAADHGNNANRTYLALKTENTNSAELLRLSVAKEGTATSYRIFGEHNKPIGMYTGNGSSAKREIHISGIGGTIIIRSSATTAGTIAIIHGGMGAFGKVGTTFTTLSSSEAKFPDNTGVLELTTASDLVNKNGVTYYYQVL